MIELEIIERYYGKQQAKRSGVPYIHHIYEGLLILEAINASENSKRAYCLHPILQSDEELTKNLSFFNGLEVKSEILILTMEYRRVANSYLSKDKVSDFVGFSLPEVREMLVADKVQNYSDFLIYHKGSHPRSNELDEYFNNWFKLLDIDFEEIHTQVKHRLKK